MNPEYDRQLTIATLALYTALAEATEPLTIRDLATRTGLRVDGVRKLSVWALGRNHIRSQRIRQSARVELVRTPTDVFGTFVSRELRRHGIEPRLLLRDRRGRLGINITLEMLGEKAGKRVNRPRPIEAPEHGSTLTTKQSDWALAQSLKTNPPPLNKVGESLRRALIRQGRR